MIIICAIVLGVLVIAGCIFAILRRPEDRESAVFASGSGRSLWRFGGRTKSLAPRAIELDIPDPSAGRLVLRPVWHAQATCSARACWLCSPATASTRMSGTRLKKPLLLADLGSEPTTRLVEALQQRVRVEGTSNPPP